MTNISGVGTIGAYGRGFHSLEALLMENKPLAPNFVDVHGLDKKFPVYSVKKEDLKDKALSRKMRRADKFSKMAVIAAADALKDSGLSIDNGSNSVGIVLSTGFGPHVTTFDFLDGYLDYGEAAVSPTSFSHSVHNAAASYISSLLGIRGPTQTVTGFDLPFQNAFLIADSWLKEGRCEHVLLGSVDELGEQMEYVFNRIYSQNELDYKSPNFSVIPAEGAVFFLLSKNRGKNHYCEIFSIASDLSKSEKAADIQIVDASLMREKFETGNDLTINKDSFNEVVDYRHLLGDMKITTAFNVAIGALMFKKQYSCFVLSKKNDTVCKQTDIKIISCLRPTYNNSIISEIYLKLE